MTETKALRFWNLHRRKLSELQLGSSVSSQYDSVQRYLILISHINAMKELLWSGHDLPRHNCILSAVTIVHKPDGETITWSGFVQTIQTISVDKWCQFPLQEQSILYLTPGREQRGEAKSFQNIPV